MSFHLSFTFEPLQQKDVDACVEAILSTLKGQLAAMHEDKETIKRMIYGPQVITLVAKQQDKIAGLISGTLPIQPRIMFLTVTDRQSAEQGLGATLIDQFVQAAKKQQPKSPFILHNEFAENYNAIGLFSMKGFTITGFIRDTITNRDVVFMKKPI